MLHPDGIEVFIRPTGSNAVDARYDELVLPLKADYEGRYLQCFIPRRVGSIEIVVKYLDELDVRGASSMLAGVMLKPADVTNETTNTFVLGFAAHHAKTIPGEGVFSAGPSEIPMLESMASDGTRLQFHEKLQKLTAAKKKRWPKMCRCGDPGHRNPTSKKPFTRPVKMRYPSEQKKREPESTGKVCDNCNGFRK